MVSTHSVIWLVNEQPRALPSFFNPEVASGVCDVKDTPNYLNQQLIDTSNKVATVGTKAFLEHIEVRVLETHYALGNIRRPQAERAPAELVRRRH
jgi:hypothetical protein